MGFLRKSIYEIHEALINGLVTPEELVREALTKAHDDKNNAFEFISDDFAYEELKHLNEKDKNNLFWGIPYALKDNFSTKGIPTCASSNILEGYVPIFSAEIVNRLSQKGAILIGKTTLDEFGMGGHGTSGHHGFVYNPWDNTHKREIGGSSSGSAVAVSAGIVPFAIGTDTGDSVRKPASYACLVGFKPTWGRISRYGLFPFAPSLDHVAFFTRNVTDSAALLEALAGHDYKDLTSSKEIVKDYKNNLNPTVKDKKVAIIKEIYDAMPRNDELKVFEASLMKLKEAGATIEFVSLDINLCRAIYPTYFVISSAEATSNTANLDGIKFGFGIKGDNFEETLIKTRTAGFSNQIKRRFLIGSYSLLKENKDDIYLQAQRVRKLITNRVNEILKSFDAIYLPSASSIAPEFNKKPEASYDLDISDNFMAIANFAGLPSITVPLGFVNGMPYGVNITTSLFNEQGALDFALAIENITGIKDLSARGEKHE